MIDPAAIPHTVMPATTSVAAFPGVYPSGPVGEAVQVSSWTEYQDQFGALDEHSSLAALAVSQFFLNGGSSAFVVRLPGATSTTAELKRALLAQLGAADGDPALDQIAPAVFNLMCVPDVVWLSEEDQIEVLQAAHAFCRDRQAFLIVDSPAPEGTGESPVVHTGPSLTVPPLGDDAARAAFLSSSWTTALFTDSMSSGAAYYPWVTITQPWSHQAAQIAVPPSGTLAGVYAATDSGRGVWKAPAGTGATLSGVKGLTDDTISDAVNGDLNVTGVNCLRTFPGIGRVVWGARTMAGADVLESEWKYVPVRRTALFIEESVEGSLEWAVFEPNGPALWASLVAEVTSFMNDLWRKGAFAGSTAASAYQVRCDATTTSPEDQLAGIANVLVAFSPTEAGEFVVLNIKVNTAASTA